MEKRKILITDSTVAAGRFVDRGDVIEVPVQVARDLFNERKCSLDPKAIAAREAELASEQAKPEAAARRRGAEKATARPRGEASAE